MAKPLKEPKSREHGFFTEKKTSQIVWAGGPSQGEQLSALAKDQYWTVLNVHVFNCEEIKGDEQFRNKVNAFKHSLQVYGSNADRLPDFRTNKGKAQSSVFHGHVKNSQGTTYVIEWSVIDNEKKIIAITNFAKHENFTFKQKALSEQEKQKIINHSDNIALMEKVTGLKQDAKAKWERMEKNQGTCVQFKPN